MIIISLILGCIILMLIEEDSNALQALRHATPKWADRMSEYNCYLLETCTKGGPRACGWDEINGFLAYFKDICAMYQVNCNSKGRSSYVVQNNIVCKVKSQFVNKKEEILSTDLPTVKTTRASFVRQKEWWWLGSTTDQYKYLQNIEVNQQ